ncbi:unnamed protein product [Brachionus calyciflorus]|uniref:Uncharacterized protein n=1 Tax=Brachionus calyciflorus TaxID=104777 RepID=A0A814IKY8_9BILA|nr:unnamed protein product [Brachionus calyciflorus]
MSEKINLQQKLNSARETSNRSENLNQPSRAHSARLSKDYVLSEKLEKVELDSANHQQAEETLVDENVEFVAQVNEKSESDKMGLNLNLDQLQAEQDSDLSESENQPACKTLTKRSQANSARSIKKDNLSARSNRIEPSLQTEKVATFRKDEQLSARSQKNELVNQDIKSGRITNRNEQSNLDKKEETALISNRGETKQATARD